MIWVAAAPLHAQVSADRPGKGGPPTPVTVTTRIVDIAAIDNVKQQFTVDIFKMVWNAFTNTIYFILE